MTGVAGLGYTSAVIGCFTVLPDSLSPTQLLPHLDPLSPPVIVQLFSPISVSPLLDFSPPPGLLASPGSPGLHSGLSKPHFQTALLQQLPLGGGAWV